MLKYGLIEALTSAFHTAPEINEHLNGIYSYVPAEIKPPYIRVQAKQDMPLHRALIYGDVVITLVSRYKGQLEMDQLLKKLQHILSKPLVTSKGNTFIFKEVDYNSSLGTDHLTQTATFTFRVKLKLK